MGYYLYKGLKKPLVLYGLKDKYIYYAMGCAVGGLMGGMLISQLINVLTGFIWIGIFGGAIYWIFKMQDEKGLYNKTKNHNQIMENSNERRNSNFIFKAIRNIQC